MYRALLSASGSLYNVTRDIRNWDDIQLLIQRNDYDGIMHKFSSQWEFAGDAHYIIKSEYDKNYLSSNVTVIIQLRNNNWEYENIFQSNLDFSTYKDDGSIININSLDSNIHNIVKSVNSTVFEYPVSELKDSRPLQYNGMTMRNSATWVVTGDTTNEDGSVSLNMNNVVANTVPLYVSSSEMVHRNVADINDLQNVMLSNTVFDPQVTIIYEIITRGVYLIKAKQSADFDISISFDFKVTSTETTTASAMIHIVHIKYNNTYTQLYTKSAAISSGWVTAEYKKDGLSLGEGDFICIYIRKGTASNTTKLSATFRNPDIRISWEDSMQEFIDIDVINPDVLLNRLAKSIQEVSGISSNITGKIYNNPLAAYWREKYSMIVAAESVRGITDAKIYTSLAKFREWMEAVFGFVMSIIETSSGYQLEFRHREEYFNTDEIKEVEIYNNFSRKANSQLIYSRVIAGYNKQDYNSVNGRDEFRFSDTFTTGITIKDNTLSLISPYRADAYGIEFLVQKRGQDTTDTDSDTNVFFVYCKESRDTWHEFFELGRDIDITGVISPDMMFNVPYSPRSCIMANLMMIGACTDNLIFSSSEGNSGVVIQEIQYYGSSSQTSKMVPVTDDISTKNYKLLNVNELSITTPEQDNPKELRGLVKFTHQGRTYKGFIDSMTRNLGKEQTIEYTLIEASF